MGLLLPPWLFQYHVCIGSMHPESVSEMTSHAGQIMNSNPTSTMIDEREEQHAQIFIFKHQSSSKMLTCKTPSLLNHLFIPPAFMPTGYIVFPFPFIRLYVRSFVRSFVR